MKQKTKALEVEDLMEGMTEHAESGRDTYYIEPIFHVTPELIHELISLGYTVSHFDDPRGLGQGLKITWR